VDHPLVTLARQLGPSRSHRHSPSDCARLSPSTKDRQARVCNRSPKQGEAPGGVRDARIHPLHELSNGYPASHLRTPAGR